ncbi:MAG: hypothetical protein GXO26_10195, partial [Crenarchaeota archaeon]|nr:hypothetical protein [Thermoproteota archaeon]
MRTLSTYNRPGKARHNIEVVTPFIGVLIFILLITIYCLYITGKIVSINVVTRFIQCSLFSIGLDGYFHKVTIVVDRSVLNVRGKNLKGILQITIVTPYREYVSNYWINDPRIICVDISKAIGDFLRYYENSLKDYSQDIPELTIWFTFYMYDNDGNLYIGSYGYDTFNLFMITSKSYLKAADIAHRDPLRAFKYPLLIILSKYEINYINFTDILKNVLNKIMMRLYNTNLVEIVKNSKVFLRKSINNCKNVIMIKIWNLTGKLRSLSYAYLYPIGNFSLYEALRCTMLMTGYVEGINIIKNMRNVRNIIEKVPISIIFKCHHKYPIEALGEVVEPPYARYISGISFLGYIISGYYNIHGNLWISKISYASCSVPLLSFLIPASFTHVADSIIVIYYIEKIDIKGHYYWLIIPISSLVPIYFIRLDLSNIKITDKAYVHNISLIEYKLIYETSLPAHVESIHKIFSECSACVPDNFSYFAYLVCPSSYYINKSSSFIEKVFSSLFYLTYFNTSPTSIAFLIDLSTYNYTIPHLEVKVYKLVSSYQPYYLENHSKYVPLFSN